MLVIGLCLPAAACAELLSSGSPGPETATEAGIGQTDALADYDDPRMPDGLGDEPGDDTVSSSKTFYGSPHHLEPRDDLKPMPLPRTSANMWMLYVLLLCLGCLALARYFFPGRFKRLLQGVLGLRFFLQLDKEGIILSETPSYLLKINFLLSLSLLLVQTINHYSLTLPWGQTAPVILFLGLVLFLIVFFILKRLLLTYLAWLFQKPHASRVCFNNIFVFNQFTGVILLPVVFLNAFNPVEGALFVAWAIVILMNAYKVIRGAYLNRSLVGFSTYYIFLYLCAVELAPLLILGKAVTIYMF